MNAPRSMMRLLAALALGGAASARPAAAQPAAFSLDGVRDAAYVIVAEDAAGDFTGSGGFAWADLTRLYAGYDATHLYLYADLPNYNPAQARGEIGLAVVLPEGTAVGPRTDPLRGDAITYAYAAVGAGGCAPEALAQVRHPDVAVRGYILGAPDGDWDSSNGFTVRATSEPAGWANAEADWGGLLNAAVPDRLAYAEGQGVELFIPWADLGLAGPADLYVSFFTTTRDPAYGIFDAVPSDPAAAGQTSAVLSQLAHLALPLAEPGTVGVACAATTVAEDAGPAQVVVQLTSPLAATAVVSYTAAPGTAGLADFAAASGVVTFTANSTQQTISIPVTNDGLVEPPETFVVTLTEAAGVSLGAPLSATVTIVDDDVAGQHAVFVPLVRR